MANLVPTADLAPWFVAAHGWFAAVPLGDLVWRAWRRGPLARPVARAARVLTATALGTIFAAGLASPWIEAASGGRGFFVMIRLIDIAFLVVAPAVGAIALAAEFALVAPPRRTRRATRWIVAILVVATAAVSVEGHVFGPRRLVVERVVLESERARSVVRIALLADLQTDAPGAFEGRVIDTVRSLDADLVLLLGDYYQDSEPDGFARDLPALRTLWSRLDGPAHAFAIRGDFEDDARLRTLFAGTPVTPLLGERRTVDVRGQRVDVHGFGNDVLEAGGAAARLGRQAAPADALRIVMTHQPDLVYDLRGAPAPDLVVAGHTHGGQVVVPGIGPLINFQRLPLRNSAGLHTVAGQRLYVSRGIGLERFEAPRVRFLCPPEITLIEIRPVGETTGPLPSHGKGR